MNPSLLELERDVMESSREAISQGNGFNPMMFMQAPDGLNIASFIGLDTDVFAPIATQILRECKAVSYIFATIAWVSATPEVAARVANTGVRLTDLPLDERDEVILLVTVEKGASVRMSSAVIWDLPRGKQVKEFKSLDSKLDSGSLDGKCVVLDW